MIEIIIHMMIHIMVQHAMCIDMITMTYIIIQYVNRCPGERGQEREKQRDNKREEKTQRDER